VLNRKKEISCSDGADNDGDGNPDCLDTDCIGIGTESCTDGIDNTCDRAIDCGDAKCAANAACTALPDGKECTANGQCAGGKCFTEAASGAPNGMCTNLTSCTVATNAGCNGGICTEGGTFDSCRARCTGTGLGSTGRCRAGFTCFDPDTNTSNNNSGCVALCTADAECSGTATGYGCNPWSKLCSSKDKGLARYGSSCTTGTQCESGYCDTSANLSFGYCFGLCRGDSKSCAADGVCEFNSSFGDNVGYCMDACTTPNTFSQCTNQNNLCRSRTPANFCACGDFFEQCFLDTDCCSGSCGFNFSNLCD